MTPFCNNLHQVCELYMLFCYFYFDICLIAGELDFKGEICNLIKPGPWV